MARKIFFASAVVVPSVIVAVAYFWPGILWCFVVVAPLIGLGLHDVIQREHSLLRIYPVIGHGRYLMEEIRPEIQQYFVESNTDGMPFSREFRSIVYQRAKGDLDTRAFGTQYEVNRVGYEWMHHSLAPTPVAETEKRVRVGGADCRRPYSASRLNISAMSFGSLSKNAILALNKGARMGGFAHNTGEGGLSPHHLAPGGDVIWQVGTGYFGCRTLDGRFDPGAFTENAGHDAVKMIEIKLSQGAKPGHGGILPAGKVTVEIARIRGVPLGHDVISPPAHTAFSTPAGLLEFVARLRELSEGKPVGFKLCVGHRSEFLGICKAMLETGILPDFITIDGAEGGTGAAPLELTDSVGMPMRDGLIFAHSALIGIGLRDKVRIIAAGKIITAFHMFRTIALGADMCNSARGMMFALGCIQARRCNCNTCPVGIATQDPSRVKGLDVNRKAPRVARYHSSTIKSFLEILSAAGLQDASEIRPKHVLRRTDTATIKHLDEIYPVLPKGCLLVPNGIPESWRGRWQRAAADHW
jgi:glutamate synthase domain-containing protein 2